MNKRVSLEIRRRASELSPIKENVAMALVHTVSRKMKTGIFKNKEEVRTYKANQIVLADESPKKIRKQLKKQYNAIPHNQRKVENIKNMTLEA